MEVHTNEIQVLLYYHFHANEVQVLLQYQADYLHHHLHLHHCYYPHQAILLQSDTHLIQNLDYQNLFQC